MKWSWLRAAILGFIIGPVPVPGDVDAAIDVDSPEPISAEEPSGHIVGGLNFYVWDEDAREAVDWAAQLLRSGGETVELAHWQSVAATSAALPSMLTDSHQRELAAWIESSSGDSRSAALGFVLCLLPSLDRTCLIASWATSPSQRLRRAVARALSAPFEAVGVRAALEQLQKDPSAEVRRLARAAAASRRASQADEGLGARGARLA